MFHCSVAEMLDRVTSAELTEWFAFYALEAEDAKRAVEKARR